MSQYFNQSSDQLSKFLEFIEDDIENVRRAINNVKENDVDAEFMIHGKSETVDESAEKTDVEPNEVVKTLVFKGENYYAVLCNGDKRISEKKLGEVVGEDVSLASPSEVKEETGYIVGGVSPFDLDIRVFMEESVLENEIVKPAAGSRVVGARIRSEDLKEVTDAEVEDLTV